MFWGSILFLFWPVSPLNCKLHEGKDSITLVPLSTVPAQYLAHNR